MLIFLGSRDKLLGTLILLNVIGVGDFRMLVKADGLIFAKKKIKIKNKTERKERIMMRLGKTKCSQNCQ